MVGPRERDDAIDLPRFAEVMAHLRHFTATPSDEVLARLGLGKAAWEAATTAWYAARDNALSKGETELTRRFGRLFAKALRDLARRRPALESLGPPVPSPSPSPSPLPAPAPVPVLVPVPVPSLSPSPPPTPPPVPPPVPVPVPPLSPSPALSPPLPPPPAFVPRIAELAGTADISAVIQGQVLPFIAASAAPSPPSMSVETRPPPPRLGETVGVSPGGALKQSTPFFKRPAPAARPDETVGLAPGAGGAPPLPLGLPDLTLPQYASLRVELQTRPEATEITLARYGLRRETRDALDAHFRARFEADPLLRMEFVRAYAVYLGWLREQGGA